MFSLTDSMPDDIAPETTDDFTPGYPGSTSEAPYGYKPDGTAYKRRPRGSGGATLPSSGRRTAAKEQDARQAAALLAQVNLLISMSLFVSGFTATGESIQDANERFESMAYNSLLNDPILCKKLLSAGTAGGKAGLVMAYVIMLGAVIPPLRIELAIRKEERLNNAE